MKINRNALLAGAATLALIAGTGLASAQEQQKGPATPQAAQPHAAPPANNRAAQPMNKGMSPGGANHAAPDDRRHSSGLTRGDRSNEERAA